MSIIAAITDGTRTWIGSDTMGYQDGLRIPAGPKWGVWTPDTSDRIVAIGSVGHHRTGELVRDQLVKLLGGAPAPSPTEVATRLRALMLDDGWKSHQEAGLPCGPIGFLLARRGAVWHVSGDFGTVQVQPGVLWAEGSGMELAIGAGHALAGKEPLRVLQAALEAACCHCDSCGGTRWTRELGQGV